MSPVCYRGNLREARITTIYDIIAGRSCAVIRVHPTQRIKCSAEARDPDVECVC